MDSRINHRRERQQLRNRDSGQPDGEQEYLKQTQTAKPKSA
jgi:hypothetical protein